MTGTSGMDGEELVFPAGLRLLAGWQAGSHPDRDRLRNVFDAALAGSFDDAFKIPAPENAVHISGSIDLLTLGVMFDLYGVTAAELYKADPERYVRSVLTSLKLLGMQKMYLSWPVYAFTAEALGQPMIYSDRFSPGTNPDDMLVKGGRSAGLAAARFDQHHPDRRRRNPVVLPQADWLQTRAAPLGAITAWPPTYLARST